MTHRVVITGIGPVTGIGCGWEDFWNSLLSFHPVAQPIPSAFSRITKLHSQWYAPLPHFSLKEAGIKVHFESVMQQEDRMAVLATMLALEDAGFPLASSGPGFTVEKLDQCSILIGTGIGGLETAFESYLAHCLTPGQLENLPLRKKPRFNRMVIPATMPNSPAAWVSICYSIHGQSATINASCASGTAAIGEAFRRIHDGYDHTVLCGGVECLREESGAIMRGFDMLGALTKSNDGQPRPFSRDRSGFLFSEGGACMLVLESLDRARARNARIYAEIIDYRACSDAATIVQIEKDGTQIASMLRGITHDQTVDYLNAHGTGTETNDEVEAHAIQTVFGDVQHQPLINSTKGILGHTLGASGAIETAVCALSIVHDRVHGNLTDNPIDNLNLPLHPLDRKITTALTVSYGFGGHNAALLLGKAA